MLSQIARRAQLPTTRLATWLLVAGLAAAVFVVLGGDSAHAAAMENKVLASSSDSYSSATGYGNRGMHFTLKRYAVDHSMYNAKSGALINSQGYNNTNSTCGRKSSMPWLPSNSNPYSERDTSLGYGYNYNGNSLLTRGDCSNRYQDGGTNSGSWLPADFQGWTSPGSAAGFSSTIYRNVSTISRCNSQDPAGGNPPLISRISTASDPQEQAYTSRGIFSYIWGSSPPGSGDKAAGVGLYSYGSGLIRNQFNVDDETYERLQSSGSNAKVYAQGDDWVRVYLNGRLVHTTTYSGSTVTKDVRSILRRGLNVIAFQVHDKAHWRLNNRVSGTTGVCYNITAQLPLETEVSPQVSLSGGSVLTAADAVTATARVNNINRGSNGRVNWSRYMWYSNDSTANSDHTGVNDHLINSRSGTSSVPSSGLNITPSWTESPINDQYSFICTSLRITPANTQTKVVGGSLDYECKPIGKQPLLQVSGGDIIARRSATPSVETSSAMIGGNRYGSWGEYGIFGRSSVNGMYSGGSLMAVSAATSTQQSSLIFANKPNNGHFTSLAASSPLPSLPDWEEVDSSSSSINIRDLDSRKIYNLTSSSVSLRGANIAGSIVIRTNGTVRLGDISYAGGTITRPSQIPQVIIIANNIYIDSATNRVDAWLIARNNLSTCGTPPSFGSYFADLSRNTCNRPLNINGPVQAGHLLLRRTAGAAGTNRSTRLQPAELFNTRPDAYIWAYNNASSSGAIRTETVRELPPRF